MSAALTRTSETRTTDFDFQKYAKFKPHSVILQTRFIHYSYDENGNRVVVKPDLSQKNANSLMNLEKGASGQWNGYMSPATRRNVKGKIENFLTAVQLNTTMQFPKSFPSTEVYPTFLTLTLPAKQIHCDNDIKRECFLRFIEWLTGDKEKGFSGWGVKNYIWVAETQKNHNIHFHLIIDRALPRVRINQKWNQIIERFGYVTRFRNKQNYIFKNGWFVRKEMLESYISQRRKECQANKKSFNMHDVRNDGKKKQLEAYNNGIRENWNNPPSTKIHAIQNIKKLTAYVSKYMTKAPEVNVKLGEGEKLIEENGKYFIQTELVTPLISLEGHEMETVETKTREVKVSFTNRYIRGRVWGSSKLLHADSISPYTIALETFSMVTTTTTEYRPVTISQPAYTINIFGERVFSHMEKVVKVNEVRDTKRDIAAPDVDADAARYVEFLTTSYVPKADIDKATAKAGEQFRHYGGVIVPLENTQKDILRMYSPPMFERYKEHYRGVFNFLYAGDNE
ncbi:rolling circle replication-associated protein [Dyadobacter aurulentus]|uniref:rolling circle replication-associated protein n=1 Tax=Dyadobacter sp. UC 10 TaxID=2605428 RepID=UPI0011F11792|nr:hypothetical protein [Dyadobacter sp. UC 10]KAA0992760.1 hypothetical protein FXO21_22575 [Dyadobacter sp. UC 10]